MSYRIIAQRNPYQQQEIKPAGFIIKIKGKEYDIDNTQHHPPAHHRIEKRETGKKEEEQPAAENQRIVLVIFQQLCYFIPINVQHRPVNNPYNYSLKRRTTTFPAIHTLQP